MPKPVQTSLNEIALHEPDRYTWRAFLQIRGYQYCERSMFRGDSTIFNVSEIGGYNVNSVWDYTNLDLLSWTARMFKGEQLDIYRYFALWCAQRNNNLYRPLSTLGSIELATKYLSNGVSTAQIERIKEVVYIVELVSCLVLKNADQDDCDCNKLALGAYVSAICCAYTDSLIKLSDFCYYASTDSALACGDDSGEIEELYTEYRDKLRAALDAGEFIYGV